MGRFSAEKSWDLWSQGGWSHGPATVPIAIDHVIGAYRAMRVFNHPQIWDGLLGVASDACVRSGPVWYNMHGMAVNFAFDGTGFQQWKTGAQYDPFYTTALIATYSGDDSDFAFDAASRTGVLVGTFGSMPAWFKAQLTATKFIYGDPAQKWHRWHRPSTADDPQNPIEWGEPGFAWTGPGRWYANNSWPNYEYPNTCRKTFVFDPDVPLNAIEYKTPRVTHIQGTSDYLVTFKATGSALPPGSGGALKAAHLRDYRTPIWRWWNGTAWQAGPTYAHQGIAENGDPPREQTYWYGGKIVILFRQNGYLTEIVYDNETESFTPAVSLNPLVQHNTCAGFCVVRDKGDTLWLYYTPDGNDIYLRQRAVGQGWTQPQLIFSSDSSLFPVGANFVNGARTPVLFLSEFDGNPPTARLLAISPPEPFWKDEEPLVLDPLPPVAMLDPLELTFVKQVANTAPDQSYGSRVPASMGIDADGYVYAPKYGGTGVVVHPPNSTSHNDNHGWGNFWDFFWFPGGAAVDRQRGKVYFADGTFAGSGGSVGDGGTVSIWETSLRDQSVGYKQYGGHAPNYWNQEYHPQLVSGFGWCSDVAVDEQRGLLYVSHGLRHRVDVYDIEHLADYNWTFGRAGLFEYGISQQHRYLVQQLVDAMVDADFLSDGGPPGNQGGPQLTWVSGHDLEAEIIPFLKNHSAYGGLDYYEQFAFLRNVRYHNKAYMRRPVYLYSFGSYGSGDGQMIFPQGLDLDADGNVYVVDCENHRIQKWELDDSDHQRYAFSWGGLGRGPGQFLYPLYLAVDDAYNAVHITDPLNNRIQVFDKDGNFRYEWGAWTRGATTHYLDWSVGVATDERGAVYVGVGPYLAKFRVPDRPPVLTVDSPQPCDVIPYGLNTIRGEVADDRGVDRLDLSVTAEEQLIFSASYDLPPAGGPFSVEWTLPGNVAPGTVGTIRLAVYDLIQQTDTVTFRVYLGGPGDLTDTDQDGFPDDCDNCPDHYNPGQEDCDGDGLGDACAIASGYSTDCNQNGIPDTCDLFEGTSPDCNQNGVPDECEPDCNQNGIPDDCDLAAGTSQDCNENGRPDECDIADGISADCQPNGIPDECDLASGHDCNSNGVPDECDVAQGVSADCQPNGIPDECDLASGRSHDCNRNGIPDECDVAGAASADCQPDGVPDECQLLARMPTSIPTNPPLSSPSDLVQDASTGDLIVATASAVFRVAQGGSVSTLLPHGSLSMVTGVTQDALTGDFILAAVSKGYPPAGGVYRLAAGGELSLIADFGGFQFPQGVTQDAGTGDFIVTLGASLRRVTPGGQVTTIASGQPLSGLRGLTQEAASGDFIAAGADAALFRVTGGGVVTTIASGEPFVSPQDVAQDLRTGDFIVTDPAGETLMRVTAGGEITALLPEGALRMPMGIIKDARSPAFLVADQSRGLFAVIVDNDCNGNGIPDECDIAGGTLRDGNGNGVPDECERALGDTNCDGAVGFSDIDPFILALQGGAAYYAQYPQCNWLNADCNCDGTVDFGDINPFLSCVQAGGCNCP